MLRSLVILCILVAARAVTIDVDLDLKSNVKSVVEQTVNELAPNISAEAAKFLAAEDTQQATSDLMHRTLVRFLSSHEAQAAAAQFVTAQWNQQGSRLFDSLVLLVLISCAILVGCGLLGFTVGLCIVRCLHGRQESSFLYSMQS